MTISDLRRATRTRETHCTHNTEVSTAVNGGTSATIPASITMTADTIRLTKSPNIHTDSAGAAPAGNAVFNAKNLHHRPRHND